MKWVCDLNESDSDLLAFLVDGKQHWAMYNELPISQEVFAKLLKAMSRFGALVVKNFTFHSISIYIF